MEQPQDSFAEALKEAHTDLLRDLLELERAAGSETRGGPEELAARLGKVRAHLTEHFRFEEEGGYMAPVLKEEPKFTRVAEELLAQHGQMAQALDELLEEIARVRTWQDALRERLRAWVGQVRQHESRENKLVQEAFYSSGATGD
jgi:hypothetical protein